MRILTAFLSLAGLGLLLVTAACAGSAQAPQPATPSSSATPSSPSAGAVGSGSIPLTAMPTGTVTLTWDPGTKVITAAIAAYGFTPGSHHAIHLHPGTCRDQSQPPSVPFPDISADQGGAVNQTVESTTAAAGGIPMNSYLNIHLGASAQPGSPKGLGDKPIACADIPAGTPAGGPVTLHLVTSPTAARPAQGGATLAYDASAHTLQVEVTATGLAPNSSHAVHIHSGTCEAQGDVLYPLPDLRADGTGAGSVSTTLHDVNTAPPATGWYVNLHLGPMSQILQGDQPTLMFAPLLCADVKG